MLSIRADAYASISRILEAAGRVFATGGGTLSRIADEAGVGIATLYRHFPNRQALALAVYDRILTTEVEPMLQKLGSGDVARPVLLDLAERLSDVASRELGLVAEIGSLAGPTTDFLRRNSEKLAEAVRRAQDAGNLRPDLSADDVPIILAMAATGLGMLGANSVARRRYLSLLLDALNPARTMPLPSVGVRA
ncbi:MAG: helix-turn-helix domain-containing protein [Rhodoglobus sp.]